MNIQMVDLSRQLEHIKEEVDAGIQAVLTKTNFIKGEEVTFFEEELAQWVNVKHVISCGNGTDALQLAFMALDLKPGDEILVPTFTYVATAEVIALLGLIPIFVDVEQGTFGIDLDKAAQVVTPRTKAIVPVHLFGQCANMEALMHFAQNHNLFVVEDTAQAIGAKYTFSDGSVRYAGTIGHIGTTSFFPSKNLGCYGDGGAMFTNDDELAKKLKAIANHGQSKKYYHSMVGVNSRLDTIQAAILRAKLPHLQRYCDSRGSAAEFYDNAFANIGAVQTPIRDPHSTHVFHQYTLRILAPYSREKLKAHLAEKGIPSMIYYPLPLHHQEAYKHYTPDGIDYPVSVQLCTEVLSLPMHTELTAEELAFIANSVTEFFN
jgi:UDP-2-acetamido-2-deoxy-ribo-hexuluronate aminotransferase